MADPQWRAAQLDLADPETVAAVKAIAGNRARWFDAYNEDSKKELLNNDFRLRSSPQMLLQQKGTLASPELREFSNSGLIAAAPAKTDARLLFHENPWRGFDIVIGNPPNEALNKSMDKDTVKRYCSILPGSTQLSYGKALTHDGGNAAGNAAGRWEARLKALRVTQQVAQNPDAAFVDAALRELLA